MHSIHINLKEYIYSRISRVKRGRQNKKKRNYAIEFKNQKLKHIRRKSVIINKKKEKKEGVNERRKPRLISSFQTRRLLSLPSIPHNKSHFIIKIIFIRNLLFFSIRFSSVYKLTEFNTHSLATNPALIFTFTFSRFSISYNYRRYIYRNKIERLSDKYLFITHMLDVCNGFFFFFVV
jgi:hypothetical protein